MQYKDKVFPVNNAWILRKVYTKKSYSFISRSIKNKLLGETTYFYSFLINCLTHRCPLEWRWKKSMQLLYYNTNVYTGY